MAQYEYGPFGEVVRATGTLAFVNPFRFSTTYQDDEAGFLHYGYRYYNPSAGNQLYSYPPGTDLSRWFESNQRTTLNYWTQIGVEGRRRSIKSARAMGTNPESLSDTEPVDQVVTPGGLLTGMSDPRYWIPWPNLNPKVSEFYPDDMGQWNATKALGRYVIHFRNIRVSRVYCSCKPCFFWQARVEITDTPGITSAEDGLRGTIGRAMGILTDSPPVVIAPWPQSGLVCCDSIKGE